MFNSQQPSEKDLPTSTQLLKATVVAIAVAFILIVIVVLPAEYGSDPTGMGRILGLKEMGEIKMSLLEESQHKPAQEITASSTDVYHKEETMVNNDVVEHTLEPGQAIEIKLEMIRESLAQYEWENNKGWIKL